MKIIVFAPHSAIWEHAFPEALIAETLQQAGHELLYVTCGGLFNAYCIPMSAAGLTMSSSLTEKDRVCGVCKKRRTIIRKEFGFRSIDLIDILSQEDRKEVAKILKELTPQNFMEWKIDSIPVGKYALYEFLINQKKDSTELSDQEWIRFLPELTNALYSFFVSKKIIELEKPDRVMTYNSFYSVNHIFCELAAQRDIPHYFLHAGNNLSNRLQTLLITRGYEIANWNRNPHWETYRNYPCSKEMLSAVTNHVLALFQGKDVFAYSAPKSSELKTNLREYFKIQKNQKVLLATLSSTDERVAAEAIGVQFPDENCIFKSQVDWIRALIEYIGRRPEYCLILRVHPRNFPNKRENLKSKQAENLENILINLPDNVKVNWPAENISIYDMAEITNVVLNAWSNAGKEMSLLGLPVVLYSRNLVTAYPAELNYVGVTIQDYFEEIDRAITDGFSFENIRKAYRWCAFEYYRSLINIADSYPRNKQNGFGIFERIMRRILITLVPNFFQILDCKKRAHKLKEQKLINKIIYNKSNSLFDEIKIDDLSTPTLAEETEYIKKEISRLINVMYGDKKNKLSKGLDHHLIKVI